MPDRSSRRVVVYGCSLGTLLGVISVSPSARADSSAVPAPASSAPSTSDVLTPPSLKTRAEGVYAPQALADRIEGAVGLELTVDAAGLVTDAKVVRSLGHGLDEAALHAVRRFTFEPAKRGSIAIVSTVQLDFEFHLPAPRVAAAAPAILPAAPPPAAKPEAAAPLATVIVAPRPISAASSFAVRDREFQLRPIASVQDILRVTPGLVMVQHSGGGKANQYFLRGFDADHGTDLALSIDGIPINMPSHAHGQGYADTNFLIPETIEHVEITKGPYFAEQGDFATAGAVNLSSRRSFDHSSVGFAFGGSPGYGGPSYRGLLIASPEYEKVHTLFAAEVGKQDGPFVYAEDWNKYKLFHRITFDLSPTSALTFGESSYAGNWNGSGQIAARAVDAGTISRFGSLDPSEGGSSARHQAFAMYKIRPTESTEATAMMFLGTYRFDLYSNFTGYLVDPVNGDEIHQVDRRTFMGAQVSYRILHDPIPSSGIKFDTRIGATMRNDDIHNELWSASQRQNLANVRLNDVHESSMGAWAREEIAFTKWLRFVGGLRADFLSFAVDDLRTNLPPGTGPSTGVTGASQWSPKASLVATPIQGSDPTDATVDVYVNYGRGFHSNDARGVVLDPTQRVTPITRAVGSEIGSRGRFFGRWDVAAALWQLDLDSETVWNGDSGDTSPSGATHRYGAEFETRYAFTDWLAADLDVTFTKSYFSTDGSNGAGLALAPKQSWSGGLSMRHPSGIRAGLRFFGIGDRPANDSGTLIAPGFTQIDLHAGYRHRWFDVALDVENLLNGTFRSAQFATVSRLQNEPSTSARPPAGFTCGSVGASQVQRDAKGNFAGCEDVDYTPAYPFTLRVTATAYLD
ncbi:MAG: TonB family protein [Polyangiales bacterium]